MGSSYIYEIRLINTLALGWIREFSRKYA